MKIPWLEQNDPLPEPETALKKESQLAGLVAAGGGLRVERLLEAYQSGMFPWFSQGQPVLWWSPDPRMVLDTSNFKLHPSFRKTLRQFILNEACEIRIDHDFSAVITHCSKAPRKGQPGTWIVDDMIAAYENLHAAGYAHSVETWKNGKLTGGLYCVSIGQTLFGESMFALETDASKIALAALVAYARQLGMAWIDCQQNTKHLASLGAQEIPRSQFLDLVRNARQDVHHDWLFRRKTWELLISAKVPV